MDSEAKQRQKEADSLRTVAFFGVALSTIATLLCVVAVPMVYNYMQHMQSVMLSEVEYCKLRSVNILREVTRTQVSFLFHLYIMLFFYLFFLTFSSGLVQLQPSCTSSSWLQLRDPSGLYCRHSLL